MRSDGPPGVRAKMPSCGRVTRSASSPASSRRYDTRRMWLWYFPVAEGGGDGTGGRPGRGMRTRGRNHILITELIDSKIFKSKNTDRLSSASERSAWAERTMNSERDRGHGGSPPPRGGAHRLGGWPQCAHPSRRSAQRGRGARAKPRGRGRWGEGSNTPSVQHTKTDIHLESEQTVRESDLAMVRD